MELRAAGARLHWLLAFLAIADGFRVAQVNGSRASPATVPKSVSPPLSLAALGTEHQKAPGHQPVYPKNMQTVEHDKVAGNGYEKGSPLYKKQEALRGASKTPETPYEIYKESMTTNLPYTLASLAIYVLLTLIVAHFYRQKFSRDRPLQHRKSGEEPHPALDWCTCGFSHGIFEIANCGQDWHICLSAFCCPVIRWADTVSRAANPPAGFWAALCFMLFLVCLCPLTFGVANVLILFVLLYWRVTLREQYNHTHHKTRAAIEDAAMVCCCGGALSCCMIVQEAREVEYTSSDRSRR